MGSGSKGTYVRLRVCFLDMQTVTFAELFVELKFGPSHVWMERITGCNGTNEKEPKSSCGVVLSLLPADTALFLLVLCIHIVDLIRNNQRHDSESN